jgi:transposase
VIPVQPRPAWIRRVGAGQPQRTAPSERLRVPTARRNRCRAWRQRTGQHTGHGNTYLAVILGNAAADAAKTDPFLGERHRYAAAAGSELAIVATGRSILVIAWHLLSNPRRHFRDLGPGFYAARIDPERRKRTHIRQLEALGYTVALQPAA